MKNPLLRFAIRWLMTSLGLWIAAAILSGIDYQNKIGVILVGGFILAVVNAILKPLVVILSLPAILLTLGLFMIIINGLMLYLVSSLYSPLQINGFGSAVLGGIIIAFVNFLVTTIIDSIDKRNKE